MPAKLLPDCYGLKKNILTFLHLLVIARHRTGKTSSQAQRRYFFFHYQWYQLVNTTWKTITSLHFVYYYIFHINFCYFYSYFLLFSYSLFLCHYRSSIIFCYDAGGTSNKFNSLFLISKLPFMSVWFPVLYGTRNFWDWQYLMIHTFANYHWW